MGTFLAVSLALLVPATFVAFAVAIYRERRLAAYLERAHPGVWAEIAPLPGANASVSSPFSRFVQQRRYLKLGDPQASELGDRTRKAFYFAVTLFFVLLAVGLAVSVSKDST